MATENREGNREGVLGEEDQLGNNIGAALVWALRKAAEREGLIPPEPASDTKDE